LSIGLLLLAAVSGTSTVLAQETLLGVTVDGSVVTFDSHNPGVLFSNVPITGLNANDRILGVDWRPATNTFVAIGETSQLYTLDPTSGVATPIGAGFAPALENSPFTRYGIDINPTVDRVRVVGANSQNRRLNPVTGAAVQADTTLTFNPALNLSLAPRAVGTAYTNSVSGAPAGSTRQFVLDSFYNILGEVGSQAGGNASFNGGIINSALTIMAGGSMVDFGDNAGFDISGVTGTAYASLDLQSSQPGTPTGIYTIDLASGAAVLRGSVPAGLQLRDVTVVPAPGAAALLGIGAMIARRRRR
jgi:hypothetical protein